MSAEIQVASVEVLDEQRPLNEIPVSLPGGEADDATDETGLGNKEQLTVFHSADNFNVKHPLMNTWTLWFTKPPSGKVSFFVPSLASAAGWCVLTDGLGGK